MNLWHRNTLLLSIIIIFLAFTAACTHENQALPIPEFPLSEDAITDVLQEAGLPWRAEPLDYPDGPMWRPHEDTLTFTLYRDGSTIGFLRSSLLGSNKRVLNLNFLSGIFFDTPMDIYAPSEEYRGNIIVFATLLYGGFASKDQVLHYFNNEIDSAAWYFFEPPYGHYVYGAIWEREFDNAYFHIRMVRPMESTDEYFMSIHVLSSREMLNLPPPE